MTSRRAFNRSKNLPGSFIIFWEDFQLLSLIFPFLSTSMVGSMPAISCIAASHVASTLECGVLKAFSSMKSFLSKTSRAASACSTSGIAATKSFSHSSFFTETCSAICWHFTASTLAFSASALTFAFSRPTSSAKTSAFSAFSFTTTALSLSSSSKPATCSCVSRSLTKPLVNRIFWPSRVSIFFARMMLYNLMSSKKLFGVLYAYLRS
mmetsp:Transcript_58221/g.136148  ORF Transcript_58221/g.136148 Transcript_58221/m.136148 type:complete len:209 (-) Transcript_58221:535-1161(-)